MLGGVAGYYGGVTDNIIMRILDVIMCIPGDLLALCIVAAFGTNLGNLLIALIIGQIPATVRIVRATILGVSSADYIEAAQCHGARDARIIAKYVIPNAMGPIIVNATVNASRIIISVSSLSFLGLGIQPPAPEWGDPCLARPRIHAYLPLACVRPWPCAGNYIPYHQYGWRRFA